MSQPIEDHTDTVSTPTSPSTSASVNGQPVPVSTRVYARQGPTMTSHSSFLSPYIGTESSSSSNPTPQTSKPGSAPTSPVNSRRPPNLTSRSTMMRRRAALEDLCLGVEGVPMHRDMLNDFTSVVKRVFGTKLSMVSIMRDEIEMIGMRGDKVR